MPSRCKEDAAIAPMSAAALRDSLFSPDCCRFQQRNPLRSRRRGAPLSRPSWLEPTRFLYQPAKRFTHARRHDCSAPRSSCRPPEPVRGQAPVGIHDFPCYEQQSRGRLALSHSAQAHLCPLPGSDQGVHLRPFALFAFRLSSPSHKQIAKGLRAHGLIRAMAVACSSGHSGAGGLSPPAMPTTCHPMPRNNARAVQHHRTRGRARGLRPIQPWLPDTSTPEFAAQVAHDIASVAERSPDDAVLLDAFERIAAEDLGECP